MCPDENSTLENATPRSTQSLSAYKTQGLDLPYTLGCDLDSAGRDVE
jgi:hypothetical protein